MAKSSLLQEASPTPRILMVRLSALGDVVHGLPVLCALRRRYPHAYLSWLVEDPAAPVLERHPALDRLIRVRRGWLKSPRAVWKLRREIVAERFDVTIDLQCLTKSAVAARLSGAGRRIGVGGADGRELSKWFNNELLPVRAGHVIEHYLGLLRPLGIDASRVEFNLPQWPEAVDRTSRFLRECYLAPGRFGIVNPGAGWPSKQWPPQRYGAVAEYLGRRYGLRSIALWAGATERTQAEAIVASSRGWALLAPPTSIHELAEFARSATLFIGSDTGPLHLAVAVGAPTISLHGTTRASWSGAYGPQSIRLQAYYEAGSSRGRRRADNRAMRAISTETVCQASDRLLQATLVGPVSQRIAA